MEAIILAGGKGTRLSRVVNDVPKPMAPINGKPFLEYILNDLNKKGFDSVILAVGYKNEVIINYFGNRYKNIKILYSIENIPLGTGGCVKKALLKCKEKSVYIINGDTFFNIDFSKMKSNNKVMIACKYMRDFSRYGKVEISGNRIVEFKEKLHHQSGYINGGIYLVKRDIFEGLSFDNFFSMEKDFFEKNNDYNIEIDVFISDGYFIDIGIPEDYDRAKKELNHE